jgi:hypothetical protein
MAHDRDIVGSSSFLLKLLDAAGSYCPSFALLKNRYLRCLIATIEIWLLAGGDMKSLGRSCLSGA